MKTALFISVLATCSYLVLAAASHSDHPIESFSKDASYKTHSRNLIYSLSRNTDSYYYAYCKERKSSHSYEECEVTEEIPVVDGAFYTKTCHVKYDTSASDSEPEGKYLKSWGDHRVLLVDFNKNTLWIQLVNMTSCDYKNVSILNIDEFQMYARDDKEFDVLWISNGRKEDDFKSHILRNTYGEGGQLRAESQLYAPRPDANVANLSDTWEALFLEGNVSYHRETRRTDGKVEEVISKVLSDHTNKTELMSTQVDTERFLTSDSYGELGVCLVSEEINCRRYDVDANLKANFTLSYSDLLRGHEYPRNLVLRNLKDGKSMILILNHLVEANDPVMRSFTAVVVHPDGDFQHPLEVEFDRFDFKCSSKMDPIKRKEIPPTVNVVELDDKFCFQFMCSDVHPDDVYSRLRYRMKCAKKELFGTKTKDTPDSDGKSGHDGITSSVFLIGSLSALAMTKFVY